MPMAPETTNDVALCKMIKNIEKRCLWIPSRRKQEAILAWLTELLKRRHKDRNPSPYDDPLADRIMPHA